MLGLGGSASKPAVSSPTPKKARHTSAARPGTSHPLLVLARTASCGKRSPTKSATKNIEKPTTGTGNPGSATPAAWKSMNTAGTKIRTAGMVARASTVVADQENVALSPEKSIQPSATRPAASGQANR